VRQRWPARALSAAAVTGALRQHLGRLCWCAAAGRGVWQPPASRQLPARARCCGRLPTTALPGARAAQRGCLPSPESADDQLISGVMTSAGWMAEL
jgi:hypothetical protein